MNADNVFHPELIQKLADDHGSGVKLTVNRKERHLLDDDDTKVISMLVEILKNYERLDIYNKKQLYLFIREGTGLPARKITKTLNKIQNMYYELKDEFINE